MDGVDKCLKCMSVHRELTTGSRPSSGATLSSSPMQWFSIQWTPAEGAFLCVPVAELALTALLPHSFPCWSPLRFSRWPLSTWRHPSEPGPWPTCALLHLHYALAPAPLMDTLTSWGNKSDPSHCWSVDSTIMCPPPAGHSFSEK